MSWPKSTLIESQSSLDGLLRFAQIAMLGECISVMDENRSEIRIAFCRPSRGDRHCLPEGSYRTDDVPFGTQNLSKIEQRLTDSTAFEFVVLCANLDSALLRLSRPLEVALLAKNLAILDRSDNHGLVVGIRSSCVNF